MTDWAKLKVVDLKAELKKRDLPQHGLKADLVARLDAADEEQNDAPPGPADGEAEAGRDEAQAAGDQAGDEQEGPAAEPVRDDEAASNVEESLPLAAADEVDAGAPKDAPESEPEPEPESELQHPLPAEESSSPSARDTQEPKAEATEPERKNDSESSLSARPDGSSADDVMAVDPLSDTQKRKRSGSPSPDEEAVAKRARKAAEVVHAATPPDVQTADDPDTSRAQETTEKMDVDAAAAAGEKTPSGVSHEPSGNEGAEQPDDAVDLDRDVAPAIHPATPALYIANLMRPLRPVDMQTHLIDLATPPRLPLSNDVITLFHLDQIRTHAFVVFASTSAASRVRTLLHDSVWPNESNRKALFVDFIPPEKVQEWIDTETDGGARSGTRWEVIYADAPDGSVEARLESATGSVSRPGVPPPSAPTGPRLLDSSNNIPLGPRGAPSSYNRPPPHPPTGPRAKRSGPGPFPPRGDLGPGKRTQAYPVISYTTVPEDLARRRISNMRSFYTETPGPYGREINRYSFEDGDSFVDRGKEVFEGIRPPHRERAMRGGRGDGGGGRGGFGGRGPRRPRPRSDRYLPGSGGGGGDWQPPPPPPRRDDRW